MAISMVGVPLAPQKTNRLSTLWLLSIPGPYSSPLSVEMHSCRGFENYRLYGHILVILKAFVLPLAAPIGPDAGTQALANRSIA